MERKANQVSSTYSDTFHEIAMRLFLEETSKGLCIASHSSSFLSFLRAPYTRCLQNRNLIESVVGHTIQEVCTKKLFNPRAPDGNRYGCVHIKEMYDEVVAAILGEYTQYMMKAEVSGSIDMKIVGIRRGVDRLHIIIERNNDHNVCKEVSEITLSGESFQKMIPQRATFSYDSLDPFIQGIQDERIRFRLKSLIIIALSSVFHFDNEHFSPEVNKKLLTPLEDAQKIHSPDDIFHENAKEHNIQCSVYADIA